MDVAFYAEEISAIGSLSVKLIEKKEKLNLLNWAIGISKNAIYKDSQGSRIVALAVYCFHIIFYTKDDCRLL